MIVLAVVMAIILILAYSSSERIVAGQPLSSPDTAVKLIDKLQRSVGGADTSEQVYIAYWSEVCNATRKLDGQHDYDIVMIDQQKRYDRLSVDYYFKLIDDGRLPEVSAYIDGARFIGGRDSCDFMPVPAEIKTP